MRGLSVGEMRDDELVKLAEKIHGLSSDILILGKSHPEINEIPMLCSSSFLGRGTLHR